MNKEIIELLSFYKVINRPLTILEIWRLIPASARQQILLSDLIQILHSQPSTLHFHPSSLNPPPSSLNPILSRRHQDLLADKKWKKLLKYSHLFSFLPFVDFVFGAGSLALGNVHADSDFDVLIGAKTGRIFTARFFSLAIFSLFNIRRKRLDHKENAKDKICLNHFVTEKSYCFKPPYNYYWQNLYRNLVPIYGSEDKIRKFYSANNSWLDYTPLIADHRWRNRQNFVKNFLENILGGFLGDQLEKILRHIQIKRITKNLSSQIPQNGIWEGSRLFYTDEELEFHPDTSRIEKILEKV